MSHAGERSPAASLGLLDATMVGIGAMIGAGIFVVTGLATDIAGPAAILVFALNLLLGLFIDPATWALALSWLALGAAIYLALERRKGAEPARPVEADPEIEAPEPDIPLED